MTRLSVNINKIATLRNARGGNMPDVTRAAQDCERVGAQGITVHPRPDERHIRYSDVRAIRPLITTEFNIEGNPTVDSFVDLVLEVVPDQVTLVPDSQSAITSNAGWDTLTYRSLLTDLCKTFQAKGIRTSIFIDPNPRPWKTWPGSSAPFPGRTKFLSAMPLSATPFIWGWRKQFRPTLGKSAKNN